MGQEQRVELGGSGQVLISNTAKCHLKNLEKNREIKLGYVAENSELIGESSGLILASFKAGNTNYAVSHKKGWLLRNVRTRTSPERTGERTGGKFPQILGTSSEQRKEYPE